MSNIVITSSYTTYDVNGSYTWHDDDNVYYQNNIYSALSEDNVTSCNAFRNIYECQLGTFVESGGVVEKTSSGWEWYADTITLGNDLGCDWFAPARRCTTRFDSSPIFDYDEILSNNNLPNRILLAYNTCESSMLPLDGWIVVDGGHAPEVLNDYSITYDLDGGINSTNPEYYTSETSDIRLATASKKGYTFEGWYTEETFDNQLETILEGSTGDLVLYAKFTAILSSKNFDFLDVLTVYPTPSKGNFKIDFGKLQGDKIVNVYSYQGKLVKQFRTNSLQSNVELNEAAGVYVINIETTYGFKTLRLLLE
jgi:uncharacterized repeat protein (TIGR02543 family)